MGQSGGSHENEFWLFSNTKMNAKNRAKKADENNGVICLVSMFSYWVMVLKLSKKVHCLLYYADFRKKSKSVKATYIYANGISYYIFSENDMSYRGLSHC